MVGDNQLSHFNASSQVGSRARLDLQWEKNGVVDVHDFDISTSKGPFVMKALSLIFCRSGTNVSQAIGGV
ncbi:unnamed protein product [Linum tenue]|uniref:Uncharacterized protein n=1 Tax=Linum tenue TaxID=586396 RepID=A0AAV0QHX5_9ROSI|nr:unnamed protein product [Linum tenue]